MIILFSTLCFFASHFFSFVQAEEKSTTLFLALDGVSFSLIKEMKAEGKFSSFSDPSLIISPFPSTTTSGFTGLLKPYGVSKASGYDERSFDYTANKVEGNLLSAYQKSPANYLTFFDYNRHSFFSQFIMYAIPGFSVKRDIERIPNILFSEPERDQFVVYIGGTDGAAHILGKRRVKSILSMVDKYLQRLQRRYKKKTGKHLEFVLFSDHGFDFKPLKAISTSKIKHHLEKHQFKLSEHLLSENDVVLVHWGNISGASFYTKPDKVGTISEVLSRISGVDIVSYKKGNDIFFLRFDGRQMQKAQVRADGDYFSYVPLLGDPLSYQSVYTELKKSGKLRADGFAHWKHIANATFSHQYPSAQKRVHDAFFKLVDNPATILCSTKQEFEFGDSVTRLTAKLHGGLKGTHGGLFWDASNAFVMTTDASIQLPDAALYPTALTAFAKDIEEQLEYQQEKLREEKKQEELMVEEKKQKNYGSAVTH
ncbi:MAG: hypothetical protein COX62_04395 [Deltaproteobacteria bacterium CG_4_10_14_0_2_um_filter_43_8]|nr:MAG: hypothetical protein COV43_05215 [Deltaproteobacteria bacterium CG11_big_fil_rev_8_21_14_0_20_42_23]PJA20579.1 MAG: hypothetical protein COX62_04395 [Deltaproteobacteria bacterium CG_4_10_14_0_2_um_filter_43_8]PJC63630.1 MAG: hypothetical protein CO021_08695 [Deltaproteobacteria bacterium CG_4_9_14_0_2_um_filter_42_21]